MEIQVLCLLCLQIRCLDLFQSFLPPLIGTEQCTIQYIGLVTMLSFIVMNCHIAPKENCNCNRIFVASKEQQQHTKNISSKTKGPGEEGPQKSSRNFVSESGRFRVQISLWILWKEQSTILALFGEKDFGAPLKTSENLWKPLKTSGNLGKPLKTCENLWKQRPSQRPSQRLSVLLPLIVLPLNLSPKKATFGSLFRLFEFVGVSGSVGALPAHNAEILPCHRKDCDANHWHRNNKQKLALCIGIAHTSLHAQPAETSTSVAAVFLFCPSGTLSILPNIYIYIYACCEVIIWSKFGGFRGYSLVQVGVIIWSRFVFTL